MNVSLPKIQVIDTRAFRVGLFVATIALAVIYIWQVNHAATAGYAMRDLESSIHELELAQERLDLQVAELQSVASVSNRVQMLGLTEVAAVKYLVNSGSVAINR